MRRVTAVAGVVLALGLSACGSSSGSGSGSATTEAKAAATTAASATTAAKTASSTGGSSGSGGVKTLAEAKTKMQDDSGLNETQAGCIVDKLVATVGETKALALVNDDRDLEQMSPDDAKAASGAVLACVSKEDFAKVVADSLYTEMKDLGVTQDQASCVGTKMLDIITPEGLLTAGAGFDFENMDPADQGKLFQVFVDCLPPEVIGKMAAGGDDTASSTSAP